MQHNPMASRGQLLPNFCLFGTKKNNNKIVGHGGDLDLPSDNTCSESMVMLMN